MNDQQDQDLRTGGRREPGTADVTRLEDRTAVVDVRGEHDLSTVPALTATLERGCAHARVVVDLAECTFIDSTVIAALLRAARTVQGRGGAFALVIPPEQSNVARVATTIHLGDLVALHPSRASALASLEGSARGAGA
jgi:anti-anti-sigma factor